MNTGVRSRATRTVLAIIMVGTVARFALAASIGLGIDESYAFAVARPFSAGYFDHPPLVFWIVGATAELGRSPLLLRAPFILLFATTSWLMFRLADELFGARAALYAVVAVSLAPVFTISSGSWVLPDGPLLFGATLAALALARIRFGVAARSGWAWWICAGIGLGVAALSKYHAALFGLGALTWLVTDRESRASWRTPRPYAALLIAIVMALPVVVWNARHDWASVRFQLTRAGSHHGSALGALGTAIGGQAGYLLPWIWLPMVAALIAALRRGPRDARSWLLVCFSIFPIAVFLLATLGGSPGLPHWPAPGYFFLAPLVGQWLAALESRGRGVTVRRALLVACMALVGAVGLIVTQVRTGWLSAQLPRYFQRGDPSLDLVDWRSLAPQLSASALGDARLVKGVSWIECAKLGYAFADRLPVRCATGDARHFQFLPPIDAPRDDVVVLRRVPVGAAASGSGVMLTVRRGARTAITIEATRDSA